MPASPLIRTREPRPAAAPARAARSAASSRSRPTSAPPGAGAGGRAGDAGRSVIADTAGAGGLRPASIAPTDRAVVAVRPQGKTRPRLQAEQDASDRTVVGPLVDGV